MVYLLYGEDTYLRDEFLKRFKKNFGELQLGINYIQVDENSLFNLTSDIETPAFGYERKLIVVKNSNLFARGKGLGESLADYLKDNISNMDTVDLIFIEDNVEKNALYKAIEEVGKIECFDELKMPQLIQKLCRWAEAYKVKLDPSVAGYLVESCGTNMQDLTNEVRKLIEYAGTGGTIKREDIDALSIKSTEAIIFDLTDSLGKKDIKNAIDILHNLTYNREPIQRILIILYGHFKKLYITELSNGKNVAENLKLKPNQMFLVKKYQNQVRFFKNNELREILESLIKLDEEFKIGNIDLEIGLEAILCRYCS